jgi:hypothetical protein
MKLRNTCVLLGIVLIACKPAPNEKKIESGAKPIEGTWQLVTGTLIEKGDTMITDYTKNISFIKIINDSHFAFLQHDLDKGKDSAVFVAGGGSYSINDSAYTEHLEYCSAREWEGNDFSFTVKLQHDTLIQRGIEKVESAGVNRINIEKYARVKK